VLCSLLLARQAASPQLVGLARGRVVQLAVPWAARVDAVSVKLFQRVRRDDVVAILDHGVIAARIEQVQAEIARLRAEHDYERELLEAELGSRRSEWDAEERAFARDATELAIRLREARVELEYDRAMLAGLNASAGSFDALVTAGHAAPTELELARAEATATAKRAAENERLVSDLEARLADAQGRAQRHQGLEPRVPSETPAFDQLQHAIGVQLGLLAELQVQRAQSILRAPFDGMIVEIQGRAGEAALRRPGEGDLRRPGEVVGAGEPVVAIAEERPTEVLVWALDGPGGGVKPGAAIELTSDAPRRQVAVSTIQSVGATMERLPESLWGVERVPRWGRPFLVPIPEGFDVAAGGRVAVRLRPSGGGS
jgi:multidrug efflux pump subunit AcrA (membrane-fusion protein)